MADAPHRRNDELRRRYARDLRRGLLASLLVHAAIFLALRTDRLPPLPFAAAGPRAGDAIAATGGGLEAVALRPPPPEPVLQPPPPIPTPSLTLELEEPPPEITPPELAAPDWATLEAQVGSEPGPAEGPGLADAPGRGAGGSAAEGRLRSVPPAPRGLTLPPGDRPRSVRGKEVGVWVFVTEAGVVAADSTRIEPSTGDRRFDERLKEQAAEWVFEPARKDGRPVGEWFRYVIIL